MCVVEAAKIIGKLPKKLVITASNANIKRVRLFMTGQVGINPADNKTQTTFLTMASLFAQLVCLIAGAMVVGHGAIPAW